MTRNGNISTFPRYTIAGRLEEVNPATGKYEDIANYTGANAIDFPAELRNRTQDELDQIMWALGSILIQMKAGVWVPR